MKFLEAVTSGRKFKRSIHESWMWIENGKVYYLDPLGYTKEYCLTDVDYRVDDWMVQTNFIDQIEKTGVLCYVWDEDGEPKQIELITKYDPDDDYKFGNEFEDWWINAQPLTPDDEHIFKEESCN